MQLQLHDVSGFTTGKGWLFPMGAGFFTQTRWYVMHSCGFRSGYKSEAPLFAQSALGRLMGKERKA